jgi:hypothetical protein
MENYLQWKTTTNGRRAPMEDELQWKTTSNRRGPPMEDKLQWKKTLDGKRFPMEDNLKLLKVEHLSNHLLDLPKLLNLSIWDQIKMENCNLQWKTTSKY